MLKPCFFPWPPMADSYEAFYLAQHVQQHPSPWLHVVENLPQAAALKSLLYFICPQITVDIFPEWDCLPYDRVSPSADVMVQRISFFFKKKKPQVILTTAAAFLQKCPPPHIFHTCVQEYPVGETVQREAMIQQWLDFGYRRQETVREKGDFAIRGSLIDIFPAQSPFPLRLDFFGNTLESIRAFDVFSQCTLPHGSAPVLSALEVSILSEVVLTPPNIQTFRQQYRHIFPESFFSENPLYQNISQGCVHPGMEHWLPLFYEENLLSCVDALEPATISFSPPSFRAMALFFEHIQDSYQARLTFLSQKNKLNGLPYHPLPPEKLYLPFPDAIKSFSNHLPTPSISEKIDPPFCFSLEKNQSSLFEAVNKRLQSIAHKKILLCGWSLGSVNRLLHLLSEQENRHIPLLHHLHQLHHEGAAVLPLRSGFQTEDLCVITEEDIFGTRMPTTASQKKRPTEHFLKEATPLEPGDFVVHVDHGIGQYQSLETVCVEKTPHDCLLIRYEGGDKLFVPVENIDQVSRYASAQTGATLDKLGAAAWQNRKARVKNRIQEIATHLIEVAAARCLREGLSFSPQQKDFEAFCARFPYPETPDQLQAIADVLNDLSSHRPMDRLICGDVGFGKTEVAIRAAYVVAAFGLQVAVVVPTTLLARQHFHHFQQRFQGTGIRVAQLSRFVSSKEAAIIRKDLEAGDIHLIIATHSILAANVKFHQLGLVIIDEEQHFGVAQKEKLKTLKKDVHVLTLSATPIPRTLQMALSGIREMSLITTPPNHRLVPYTFVLPFDGVVIREAILREKNRSGQTFYVCPRIDDLPKIHERLKNFVPEARVQVAHGQMPARDLEKIMEEFVTGAFDVLISTHIVESGIDIPTANTLIIHRADLFGLAQLYQLRGRIGRGKIRGYAYFTLPAQTVPAPQAMRRLAVLESLDYLGAGFSLASHDMDIRGAGNLLGAEQSGHIREVGVELYQTLLEEAIQNIKNQHEACTPPPQTGSVQLNLNIPVLIPDDYVTDLTVRMGLYRRLGDIQKTDEINPFCIELVDRFGPLPPEVQNLMQVLILKILCRQAAIERIDLGPQGVLFSFQHHICPYAENLLPWLQKQPQVRLRPDHKLIWAQTFSSTAQSLKKIEQFLKELASLPPISTAL